MRIALVHNPHAAAARIARVTALAAELERRGHGVSDHDSQSFLASRDAPDADLICICGGDGTAQLVISNQPDPAALPPLAVYPIGTINLLARELHYPADPAGFAQRIAGGAAPVRSRLADINGRIFLCCVSVGGDAHAVHALSEPLKARIGRLAYLAALASVLRRWPRPVLRIAADGQTISAEAAFVLRCHHYAGPWSLDRQAGLGRDTLRLLFLPRARRRDLAALIVRTLIGRVQPGARWQTIDAETVAINADGPVPVQIDGDAGGSTPVAIAMRDIRIQLA